MGQAAHRPVPGRHGDPKRGTDRYGRTKIFSAGEDHALDACRFAAISYAVYAIEELMKQDTQEEVLDSFLFNDVGDL